MSPGRQGRTVRHRSSPRAGGDEPLRGFDASDVEM